ncbi:MULTISPECIES: ATP-binding protein [unclassified Streptomyces]|uniref:ATP-binding protein n=1 Tax=unclassified Streptomyces TaxID=2593676 RepID=UPI0037883BF7
MAATAVPDTPAEFLSCLASGACLREVSADFAHEPRSALHARRLAREHLAAWGFARRGDLTERVVLTVSELMSNAVQHGLPETRKDGIALSLRFLPGVALGVGVGDGSSARPILNDYRTGDAVDGRGMQIVALESTCWTTEQLDGDIGKTVWAFFLCEASCSMGAETANAVHGSAACASSGVNW